MSALNNDSQQSDYKRNTPLKVAPASLNSDTSPSKHQSTASIKTEKPAELLPPVTSPL